MHTNIATALLDEIKERKLDTFFEAEEKMITRSTMVRRREGGRERERGREGERERFNFNVFVHCFPSFLSQDKSVLDIISDPSAGTPADKLRLFLIYYTLSPEVTDSDLSQFTAALEGVGADMTPLNYLKRWRSVTGMLVMGRYMYM